MPESRVRKSVDDKRKRVETAKSAAKSPSSTARTGAASTKKATSAADKSADSKTTSTSSTSTGSTSKTSATKSSTSKSTATKATATATAKRVTRRIEQESKPKGRPWLLPAAIVLAVLGAAWGVAYYVKPKLIPGQHGLGHWNVVIGAGAIVIAAIGFLVLRPRTTSAYAIGTRRWVPATFITVGLLGVAWLIVYYVAGTSVPFMNTLGNWNILIGMAGMAGAFIIATLWK